jgi:hypothetical protein
MAGGIAGSGAAGVVAAYTWTPSGGPVGTGTVGTATAYTWAGAGGVAGAGAATATHIAGDLSGAFYFRTFVLMRRMT